MTTTLYVDADACPVKDEAVRVAERHGLPSISCRTRIMRLPEGPLIQPRRGVGRAGCGRRLDRRAHRRPRHRRHRRHPLAARCLKKGAAVIGPTGKPFTEAGIGMAPAMRELSRHLRETGESKGYNASFTKQDRSKFLEALELAVQATKRDGG